jgi:hypothetical protein
MGALIVVLWTVLERLVAVFFLTFGAKTRDRVEFPTLILLSQLSSGI